MGRIIGIDLGTTTSEISYINNGKPEIIINNLGDRITPSVVHLDEDGDFVVGKYAKEKAPLNPDSTIKEVKRLMGSDNKVLMRGKEYRPEEISAAILRDLKSYAEDYLGEEVTEAVITVPANFNEFQRRATQKAGELAGLKVERIINEPTAAALAYGINNMENDEKILVYDIGGGTFDVTVLELFEGIINVKSSRGNNRLGGKDFDERITQYIVEDFKNKHGIDLSDNEICMSRIKDAAEKAKIELTSLKSTEITIPFIAMSQGKPISLNISLTRAKFEELIRDLVESTKVQVNEALKAAGFDISDINVVLAVGGSSRVPCIKELLKGIFPGKVKNSINPDEAVSLGASIQAGMKNEEIKSENGLILNDVCNYSLGIEVIGGRFDSIIMRDTIVPCIKKSNYTTVHDMQTEILVQIYQGESKFAIENIKLGELEVTDIPEGPEGKENVEVQFKYNLNGMLEVTATVLSTGKQFFKTVDTLNNNSINKSMSDDLNQDYQNSGSYNGNNTYSDGQDTSSLEALVKGTIQLAQNKLKTASPMDAEKIRVLLNKLKGAVASNNAELTEKYDDELTDLLFELV